jgi:hypothetical protein
VLTGGGYSEVLGGVFNIHCAADSSPMIVTRNSHVSVFASTLDHRVRPEAFTRRPCVEETRDGVARSLDWNQFAKRDEHLIVVPLYASP